MVDKKAIEICKNLLKTIQTIEQKPPVSLLDYRRSDMFVVPTARKSDLYKKIKEIKQKYNLKDTDIAL